MTTLRLAHLSDLHFGHVTRSLTQFLSKRWIGNFNLFLFRRRTFTADYLLQLPSLFESLKVEAICFTGDFTSTSLDEEFLNAKDFVHNFPPPFFVLPGNHDCYTKEAEREKTFYKFFPAEVGELGFSLEKDRIFCKRLGKNWWWIGLDCAVATPPFNAYGIFFPEMAPKIESLLRHIPSTDRVIMGNHYPLLSSQRPSHDLKNGELLRALLKKTDKVKVYLHGHDHKPYLFDRRAEKLPLILNSGSSAHRDNGGFYLLDLKENEVQVEHYFYSPEKGGWNPEKISFFKI